MRWTAGAISLVLLGLVVLVSHAGRAAPEGKSESTTAAASEKPTRVIILGSGGPMPDPSRSGPSVAVVSGGRAYLVDFGPGVIRRSVEALDMGWPR